MAVIFHEKILVSDDILLWSSVYRMNNLYEARKRPPTTWKWYMYRAAEKVRGRKRALLRLSDFMSGPVNWRVATWTGSAGNVPKTHIHSIFSECECSHSNNPPDVPIFSADKPVAPPRQALLFRTSNIDTINYCQKMKNISSLKITRFSDALVLLLSINFPLTAYVRYRPSGRCQRELWTPMITDQLLF